MAGIQTGIRLDDQFTRIMYGILDCVNMANSQMAVLSGTMNQDVDTSGWEAVQSEISQTTLLVDELAAALDQNVDAQERFNREVQDGVREAGKLSAVVSRVGTALLGGVVANKAMDWIEDCTAAFDAQRNAELQLMTVLSNTLDASGASVEAGVTVDASGAVSEIRDIPDQVGEVVVPATANTQALTAAFDAITAKASEIQSRGIYGDEAMIAGAAEFSTYFSDTAAIEMMMDTLADYAMGMSGGGGLDVTAMVDYATGLGKIMSGSYEAMTQKGFTFTEAQKAIIEGTATQEQVVAALGDEYLDASQDVRAAAAINAVIAESWDGLYESMSNTPRGQIIQLSNAWGDVKEVVGEQLYPFVLRITQVITKNWPTIRAILDSVTRVLQVMMSLLSWLVEGALGFAQAVMDNWSWISPIVYGIAAALALYGTYLAITKGLELASAVGKGLLAAATWVATGATKAETVAQQGLNKSMLASPIFWIILLFVALVVIILKVCDAIARMTGIANSGFGIITGGVNVTLQFFKDLGLTVANIALGIRNVIAALGANIMASFHNAICSVRAWFFDLLSSALEVIEGICAALNKLPFVEFDYSGISNAAGDYANEAARLRGDKLDYVDLEEAFQEGILTFDTFQDGWASKAFDDGAAWGDGIADKVRNFSLTDLFQTEPLPTDDYASWLGGLVDDVGDIAGDTGSMKDFLDCTEEDLKYLRDIAEQESVNRYTLAEVKVEQINHNNISSDMDLDGVVSGLTDAVNEAVDNVTEGVHE